MEIFVRSLIVLSSRYAYEQQPRSLFPTPHSPFFLMPDRRKSQKHNARDYHGHRARRQVENPARRQAADGKHRGENATQAHHSGEAAGQ